MELEFHLLSFAFGVVAGFIGGILAIFLSKADVGSIRYRDMRLSHEMVEKLRDELEAMKKERNSMREMEEKEIQILREQNTREEDEMMRLAAVVEHQREEIEKLRSEIKKYIEESKL